MMKLMIDIDGVLAQFETAYVDVLNEVSGKSVKLGTWRPPVWDYEELLGFTREDVGAAWKEIVKPSRRFWFNLNAYDYIRTVADDVNYMTSAAQAEVYFVTTRPGDGAFSDTWNWLRKMGFRYPNVIVSFDKGPLCKAIGITHALDDRDKNCLGIKEHCPTAEVTLLAQPWNWDFREVLAEQGDTATIEVCPDPMVWLKGLGKEEK